MSLKKSIEIKVPGSKSITNRALVLCAMANGSTKIENAAICDDTKYMLKALSKLGIKVIQKNTDITIKGANCIFHKKKNPIKIYTGNAGTTTRFLCALASITENTIKIDGDKRMRERPIKELTKALNLLGAKIKDTNGYLPITIYPQKPQGNSIHLPGNISSQYLSAILMIAPCLNRTTIVNIDQKLYSKPYIDMTIKIARSFGIKIKNKKFEQFIIQPQKINSAKIYKVESDASSASYPAAYSALHGKKSVLLIGIKKDFIQGDIKFLEYLKKMGCKITKHKKGTIITGPKKLKSLGKIDMNQTPDLVMTFAVLALFTPGTTTITNIENLRIKETDRISALKNELEKLDAKVETGKNYIKIHGLKEINHKKSVTIETYNDHRIAMSFGILKDIFPNIKIKNPNCVSKSYTTFWEDLKSLV